MSSFEKIPPQLWMLVDPEIRLRLVTVFELGKTGITEVRDQEVITDGYNADDLSVITSGRMAAYVGSEESFPRLWELSVAKARSEVNPPVGVMRSENGGIVIDEVQFYNDAPLNKEQAEELKKLVDDSVTEIIIEEPKTIKHAKRNTKKD